MSETIVIKIDKQLLKQKICGDCHQRKDLSEFYKDNTKSSGVRRICKICDAKRRHEHYIRTKKAKQKPNSNST
jgi:RNase P subunit RPR2